MAGPHVIAPIVSVTAVASKSGITIGRLYENNAQTIVNAGSVWGDRDRLDRPCCIRLFVADRGERKRFYEDDFLTGRRANRFKLSHCPYIRVFNKSRWRG